MLNQIRIRARTGMIDVEAQFFGMNRNFMIAIGIWPYQQTKFAQLQRIFNNCLQAFGIIFNIAMFINVKRKGHSSIDVLSVLILNFIALTIYDLTWFISRKLKILINKFQYTCDELKDENEIAILEKYSKNNRWYVLGISDAETLRWSLFSFRHLGLVFGGLLVGIIVPFWPSVLDFILPQNVTRPRRLLLPADYLYLSESKYFYMSMLYMDIAIFIGSVTLLAVFTLLYACLECVCGLFAVTCYRIKRALRTDVLQNVSKQDMITKGLITAVDIHRKAITVFTLTMSTFEILSATLVICWVIALSLNMFRIVMFVSSEWTLKEIFVPFAFTVIAIIYLLLFNYIAQCVTDHNKQIFATVYDVQWYRMPLRVQKLMLFLLQMGKKDIILTIAGLITLSLESFTMMMNTSMSFLTVMYSTQS